MTKLELRRLVRQQSGILLDVSLGGDPQPGAVSLVRDLQHDPRQLPWPLPPACVHTAVITHVLEYLEPDVWWAFWDELHKLMKPHGLVHCSGPYGGDDSHGWLSDPSHKTRVIEQSFSWLDPRLPYHRQHELCGRSLPRPWHTLGVARVPGMMGTISYNVTLRAMPVNGRGR